MASRWTILAIRRGSALLIPPLTLGSCGQAPPPPDPSALVVARVLEVNLPSSRTPKQLDRIAAVVRSNLPADSEVGIIVIQYPTASSDPRVFNTNAVVYHVDSLARTTADSVAPGHLAEALAREVVAPASIITYRVDVLGEVDRHKAGLLQRWVRDGIALYPDLDSIKVNFRGSETVRGDLHFRSGGGTITIATPGRR
jgi:hypothetical protein